MRRLLDSRVSASASLKNALVSSPLRLVLLFATRHAGTIQPRENHGKGEAKTAKRSVRQMLTQQLCSRKMPPNVLRTLDD
mmetsp:Transcript_17598/g.30736  ORF Transcript_17598/g.30736 Transcript_17598/m.30736 type:complete len:80 (-) Transcript_17598:1549-1788(-)